MKDIKELACNLIDRQYEDFKKYIDTEEFQKLLGVYKKDSDDRKELYNGDFSREGTYMANYLSSYIVNQLKSLCSQNEFFASKVYSHKGNFTQCMAYVIHKFKKEDQASSLSDVETYCRAVQYYYPEAEIKTVINLQLPETVKIIELTDEEIAEKEKSYTAILDKAETQKIAAEQAEAERKAKAAAEEKKRKEKEAKKKAAAEKKAKKEALKKAQESLFTEVDFSPFDEQKADSKATFSTVDSTAKPKKSSENENKNKTETNVIQLDLFSNLGG